MPPKNNRTYDGAEEKFGVTMGDKNYIVKIPKHGDTGAYSEYVASEFIRCCGFDAHKVELIEYNNSLSVMMEDFTTPDLNRRPFSSVVQSTLDTDPNPPEYTFSVVSKYPNISTASVEKFWEMYFLDAILANRDRHQGNWGYLTDNNTTIKMAPIYDNGASLFPSVGKVIDSYKGPEDFEFLAERSEEFPASMLRVEVSPGVTRKSNYYRTIWNEEVPGIHEHRKKFIRKVHFSTVYKAIMQATSDPKLPKNLVSFYRCVVLMRYLHIILGKPLKQAHALVVALHKEELL